jgi:hypothetical protein
LAEHWDLPKMVVFYSKDMASKENHILFGETRQEERKYKEDADDQFRIIRIILCVL